MAETQYPLVTLSAEEDTFCLAIIECGGNLAAAYRQAFQISEESESRGDALRARNLISRPEIAKRIRQLQEAVDEHTMISLGSHLGKLAEIRDLAMAKDQMKVAIQAERSRGEAAGFYSRTPVAGKGSAPAPGATLNVFLGSSPSNVNEWANQHGRSAPVIIDVQTKG